MLSILIFFEALIRFAQSSYSINENIGTLQVEVTVSEPFNVDIAVHIVTSDISTTGIDNVLCTRKFFEFSTIFSAVKLKYIFHSSCNFHILRIF